MNNGGKYGREKRSKGIVKWESLWCLILQSFQSCDLSGDRKIVTVSCRATSMKYRTYRSRIASCHLCSFAISLTWKPYIRGRYRSAFNATFAVLIPSAPPSAATPASVSSRSRRLLLESVELSLIGFEGSSPSFSGMRVGYTRKRRWGNVVPKYAPSMEPCREDLGE